MTRLDEHLGHFVGGVALRDPPGVQPHAGLREPNGPSVGIQFELRPPHGPQRSGPPLLGYGGSPPVRPPPEPRERAGGDVERPPGEGRPRLCQ